MPTTNEPVDTDDRHAEPGAGLAVAPFSDAVIKEFVQLSKLLSDETRLRILLCLSRNPEVHVRALCEMLGQSQPAVSHHLALLRVAGIIEPRRDGKHNFYRLKSEKFEELVDLLFGSTPKAQRRLRFEHYVLSYSDGDGQQA